MINFRATTPIPVIVPITRKLNVIAKSECGNNWKCLLSLEKLLKAVTILLSKTDIFSAVTCLMLSFLAPIALRFCHLSRVFKGLF